jgi:hypothetical protein
MMMPTEKSFQRVRDVVRFPITHPRTTFYTVLLMAFSAVTASTVTVVLLLSITLIQAVLATLTIIGGSSNAGPGERDSGSGGDGAR